MSLSSDNNNVSCCGYISWYLLVHLKCILLVVDQFVVPCFKLMGRGFDSHQVPTFHAVRASACLQVPAACRAVQRAGRGDAGVLGRLPEQHVRRLRQVLDPGRQKRAEDRCALPVRNHGVRGIPYLFLIYFANCNIQVPVSWLYKFIIVICFYIIIHY